MGKSVRIRIVGSLGKTLMFISLRITLLTLPSLLQDGIPSEAQVCNSPNVVGPFMIYCHVLYTCSEGTNYVSIWVRFLSSTPPPDLRIRVFTLNVGSQACGSFRLSIQFG